MFRAKFGKKRDRPGGRFFIAFDLPLRVERSGKDRHMSRIMKRNHRAMQRQRRNKGPEKLGQSADNTVHNHTGGIVHALVDSSVRDKSAGSVNALVELADGAEYAEQTEL